MVDHGAVLHGALEPERFFGRMDELRTLRRDARSLQRGQGRSTALCARPGAGKTELLRQWHGTLFREGAILPFWYAVPRDEQGDGALDAGFATALAVQALAFRRRDASLLARPVSRTELAEGLRSAWGEGGVLLSQSLDAPDQRRQLPTALTGAASLPHLFASVTGTPVLCLIDDAGNLAGSPALRTVATTMATSRLAPAIFALEDDFQPASLFGRDAAALVTIARLPPLTQEATCRLARSLARTAGLELGEEAVGSLALESAGSPFYVGALVRALAGCDGTGAIDVARAAAAACCDGELSRYWIDRLAGAIPDRRTRATALEVLTFCLREGEGSPDAGRLATLMLKPVAEIDNALAGLERAGVVRIDCSRIVVEDDPVLRDVVQALYGREFGRVAPAAVLASLAAEKARGAPALRRRLWRESVRCALRAIIGAWAGQSVPSILFDSAAFRAFPGASQPGEREDPALDDARRVTLPRVISVVSGRVGSGVSFPALEVDALAWGLRAEAEPQDTDVAWVARWLPGGDGGAEQLLQFDRDVSAMQAAGDLPARLVRWAIIESPLDTAGERAAAQARLATSTRSQLEVLARLLGLATPLPPPAPILSPPPTLEMELVIPRVVDVELVAARALEQLAENLAIDAQAIGRLKVALVEACINAFEHSGARDGRVRLVFTVGGGRLVVRVENRGRPLAALPSPAAGGRESRGRGWGLTLIRELVDEVALEPREDGVSLVMIKRL